MDSSSTTAFSLIELSVVLVILGLLTGGILTGQSLIRASELRTVGTEYTTYHSALLAFRDKYFAMPGDFDKATSFWGRMNSNADCVTNTGAAVSSSGACDGNGSGIISSPSAASSAGETSQFWRHLSKAGLITGEYSGLSASYSVNDCVYGTDCPISKLNTGGWRVINLPGTTADTTLFSLEYGQAFYFYGRDRTNGAGLPILTPEVAWSIDTKIDDGKPARGKVIARWWNDLCATPDDGTTFTNTNLNSSYKLSDNRQRCGLYFRKTL